MKKTEGVTQSTDHGAKFHSLEAEQKLLGGVFLDPSTIDRLIRIIDEQDFYTNAHRIIYSAIITLYGRNMPISPADVAVFLEGEGELKLAGGTNYLDGLLDKVQTSASAAHYAQVVHDAAVRRELILALDEMNTMAHDDRVPIENVLEGVERRLKEVNPGKPSPPWINVRDAIKEVFKEIEEKEISGKIPCLSSGCRGIDRIVGGLYPEDLVVVSGLPKVGKTSFTLGIAAHVAAKKEKPVLYISLDESEKELTTRLYSSLSGIKIGAINNPGSGLLKDEDWGPLAAAVDMLNNTGLAFCFSDNLTFLRVKGLARYFKRTYKKGLGLMVIDYVQLFQELDLSKNQNGSMNKIMHSLKELAVELQVPIILISRIHRCDGSRPNPDTSDLYDKGFSDRHADVVILIDRKIVPCSGNKGCSKAEFTVMKNRHGDCGTFRMIFLSRVMKFEDLGWEESKEISML